MNPIEIKGLCKSFGSTQVLKNLDLTIRPHEVVALIGESGCGKTTLFRSMEMLEIPDSGKIFINGQEITAKVINADWDRERVSVSMKALIKSPWETVAERFSKGQKIDGKISRVADFGVFINLESGIDGLVHISALENVDRNTNLKKKFSVGQEMSVVIKEIDATNRRISLVPSTSTEQDENASDYFSTHNDDDGDTYNPFAALLKK